MGEKKLILLICHSKQVEIPTADNSGTEMNLVWFQTIVLPFKTHNFGQIFFSLMGLSFLIFNTKMEKNNFWGQQSGF